jgi:hypothetical protein
MVSRHLGVCLAITAFGMAGCELAVDDGTRVLASSDAGADAVLEAGAGALVEGGADALAEAPDPPHPEAGPPEAAPPMDATVGPSCSSACMSAATSCQQSCASDEATCMAACRPPANGICQQQCTQTDTLCNGGCSDQCVTCFMKAACAGPNACPK